MTTTSFWWHVAGVREYAARGIPIYAAGGNARLIQRLLDAPHRLSPDSLERTGLRPRVIAVSTKRAIGSRTNRVVLCPIAQATSRMLMVWFPDHHLLHTAEMVQPLGPNGSLLFPESLLELRRTVEDEHMDVANMIGMHMSVTPWQKLTDALAAADSQGPP